MPFEITPWLEVGCGISVEIVNNTAAVEAAGITKQSKAAAPISRKRLFMVQPMNVDICSNDAAP